MRAAPCIDARAATDVKHTICTHTHVYVYVPVGVCAWRIVTAFCFIFPREITLGDYYTHSGRGLSRGDERIAAGD